ncbi:hypothetical protein BJ508DRAFT_314042 [Ascobolus immersus RN42]|uniref:Uncharacterized protein n=1 Tax=Ascobolus immersus RN42 TaxID=1160509 RepID=A0A3N4HM80_ASCIM|nr:hypothetical protein BJ508DRAFT_314042 [Ascobolus immersus RN42]
MTMRETLFGLSIRKSDPRYATYPFMDLVEEAIKFFSTCLGPFCWERSNANCNSKIDASKWQIDIPNLFFYGIRCFCPTVAVTGGNNIEMRWQKGLLRGRLVELIGLAVRSRITEMRRLIIAGDEGTSACDLSLAASQVAFCVRKLQGICIYLCSFRLRSQRIEDTIMRYVEEDSGMNLDVMDGINRATDQYWYELDRAPGRHKPNWIQSTKFARRVDRLRQSDGYNGFDTTAF